MKKIELLHFTVAKNMTTAPNDKICVEQLICCQKCRANACRAIAIRAVHPHSMSLAKNLGGRVGVKNKFLRGGVENFLKILLQICENLERFQKFSEKWDFLAKKVKVSFKNAIFSKILL